MTLRSDAADKLKSYVERIERLAEERRSLGDDQRALFAEAKAEGFDPKAIRAIVKRRDKDPNELAEHESILETYMHALGMVPDHPLHLQVGALACDGLARDGLVEALQQLVPLNGEIIVKVGGDPLRIWRGEDGIARAEPYVEPKAAPREKAGKGLGKPAPVLSIVTGEKVDGRAVDPAIADAVERAERRASRKRREDEPAPAPGADQDEPEGVD